MEELIKELKEKAMSYDLNNKQNRALRGAYVDALVMVKNALNIHLVSKRLLADNNVEYDHPTGLIKGKLMYDDDEFTTLILKYEGGIINLPDLDKCIVC